MVYLTVWMGTRMPLYEMPLPKKEFEMIEETDCEGHEDDEFEESSSE